MFEEPRFFEEPRLYGFVGNGSRFGKEIWQNRFASVIHDLS